MIECRNGWNEELVGRGTISTFVNHHIYYAIIMGYTIQVVNYRRVAKSGRDGLDASRSTIRDVRGSGPDLRLLILSPIQNQMVQRM